MMSQENNGAKIACDYCAKDTDCNVFDFKCVGCCARKVIRARPSGRHYQEMLVADLVLRTGFSSDQIIEAVKGMTA